MVVTPFLEACAPFTPLPKYSPRVCTCTFLTREEYIATEKAVASLFFIQVLDWRIEGSWAQTYTPAIKRHIEQLIS